MSPSVPPTPPPTAAATSTAASTAARGTILSLPAHISLAQGQALSAQVVSSGGGQIVLATHLGRIAVQTTATLPPGTPILLQVQALGETPQVLLHLPQTAGAPHGAPARNVGAPAGAAQPQPAPTITTHLTEGSIVQAAVIRGSPPQATGATPAAPAFQAALPDRASAGPSATTPPPAAQPVAPPLAAGTGLTLRVLAVVPPGNELPQALKLDTPAGGRLLAATVVGHQAAGAPIAVAGSTEIVLPVGPPLPAGSRLLLEIVGLRPPAPGETTMSSVPAGGRWEALSEALAALYRTDPALARQIADGVIPTPSTRLAGSVLFFLSAVFSGDIRRFLGADAMRQIARAPGGLGSRLASELTQLQRTATDAAGQDWRVFFVPVLTDEGLEQIRLMLRKDEGDGKRRDDEAGTRFMIEVHLSRLGAIQFDGLSRRKQLDLVVRSHQELPSDMREEIRAIFGSTVAALGLTGTIAFHVVQKFETIPVEQPARRPKDLTV